MLAQKRMSAHSDRWQVRALTKPAQRAGRTQPRDEAEGRFPGYKGTPHLSGLKGREKNLGDL